MAVTYTTAVKNSRMDAVITALGAAGVMEIGTAGMGAVLATFTFDNPAGASGGAGVLTFAFVANTVAAGDTGVAAAARLRTSGATDIVTGLTVGTGGTDIIIDNTSINNGQNVTVSAATITHA
jgi:hypothetical protein